MPIPPFAGPPPKDIIRASLTMVAAAQTLGNTQDFYADVPLSGQPGPTLGEVAAMLTTPPVKIFASSAHNGGFLPTVQGPTFTAGALVIDGGNSAFLVTDAGGTNIMNLAPTGTTTPLSIPSGGAWAPAAVNDWSVLASAGIDLSIQSDGQIVSAGGLVYFTSWTVGFSSVPTG